MQDSATSIERALHYDVEDSEAATGETVWLRCQKARQELLRRSNVKNIKENERSDCMMLHISKKKKVLMSSSKNTEVKNVEYLHDECARLHNDYSKEIREIIDIARISIPLLFQIGGTARPEEFKNIGCPACFCAEVRRGVATTSIGSPSCSCNTDSPTTAEEILDHVHKRTLSCEYHNAVWLFMLQCAVKVKNDDCWPWSKYAKKILEKEMGCVRTWAAIGCNGSKMPAEKDA